jgi:hypothetical protein
MATRPHTVTRTKRLGRPTKEVKGSSAGVRIDTCLPNTTSDTLVSLISKPKLRGMALRFCRN